MTDTPLVPLLVAVFSGLAVGVERQWSGKATGPSARFGGLRTFTLIGLIGGIAGWWMSVGLPGPATVLLAGITGVVLTAYYAASRRDIDATTEVAALVVAAAGAIAGAGQTTLALGVTALTVLLLAEKTRLHDWVARFRPIELVSAARFAVMALVILPLLPSEPLGPFGPFGAIRLRQLWALVLFFSGLSFVGFLARRAFGAHRGYAIAGTLGGLVSSTSVTLTFSRLSREHPDSGRMLASGVMGANVMLFPRVLLATAVLAPPVAAALWPAFLAPVAIGLLWLARGISTDDVPAEAPEDPHPLQVGASLQMALVFQLVLFVVSFVETRFGQTGLFASAAVLGLSDVDALTVSMSQRATAGTVPHVAAAAIALGVLSNSVAKATLALVIGKGSFRTQVVTGLLLMAAVIALWLLLQSLLPQGADVTSFL